MSSLFEYEEEEDFEYDGPWNIRFHSSSDIQDILFMFEYMYPEPWEREVLDIEENGLIIGDMVSISPKMAEDAIKSGLLAPFLYTNEVGNLEVEIKYWSVFRHTYMDFEEMFVLEIYWLLFSLERMIWSYN